jgi:hypothetical protein
MKNNVVIHTSTLELYKKVVQKALDNGYKWRSGDKDICEKRWQEYQENTCVELDTIFERAISFADEEYYEYYSRPIISAEEFLEEDSNENYISSGDTISLEWEITTEPGMWGYSRTGTTTGTSGYYLVSEYPWEFDNYLSETTIPICYSCYTTKKFNQSNNKFMGIIKNAFKSKEQKALDHFGLGNGNGGLNSLGQQEFVDYLFETQKELRKGFIEQIVEEYEKQNKGK